jgi:hypothetical protein
MIRWAGHAALKELERVVLATGESVIKFPPPSARAQA